MSNKLSSRLANGKVRKNSKKLIPITKHEDTDIPGVSAWKDYQMKTVTPLEECLHLGPLMSGKQISSQSSFLL